jgi:hypothetical protein
MLMSPYNKETSFEASDSITEVASNLREAVYQYLMTCENGSTDDAGELVLNMKHTTYTARRGELFKKGLVVNSGVKSKTRSNRNAWIWKAVPKERVVAPPPKQPRKNISVPKINPPDLPFGSYDLKTAQNKLVAKLEINESCKCPCCGVEVTK